MSYYNSSSQNSQSGYVNENNGDNRISSSTLEPDAPEFHPAAFHQQSSTSSYNTGAVKKKPNHYNHAKRGQQGSRYGSGRTFSQRKDPLPHDENRRTRTYEHTRMNDDYGERDSAYGRNEEPSYQQSNRSNNYSQYGNKKSSENDDNYSTRYNSSNQSNRSNYYQHGKNKTVENEVNSSRVYSNQRNDYYDRHTNNESKHRNQNSKNYSYNPSNDFNQFGGLRPIENESNYNKNQEGRSYIPNPRKSQKNHYNNPSNRQPRTKIQPKNAASQRERLELMLNQRQLECLVCCENIKNNDKTWSCNQCYHIMHLKCTIAWAKSSHSTDNGWRCPACQNVYTTVPHLYNCFCGKTIEPRINPGLIPHSCGEMCLRKGRLCEHKCTMLCHPGPCPDCTVMVATPCGCGATQPVVKCCSDLELVCTGVCNKLLNCGLHKCQLICHRGECKPCVEKVEQECHCGKEGRAVSCTADVKAAKHYSCGEVCGRSLSCKNHNCKEVCHEGDCRKCEQDVELVKTCPCGKTDLEVERKTCLDSIPCCDKVCGKFLKCGPPGRPHTCKLQCHVGDCPPCLLTTLVRCRCGHMDKELACQQLTTKADDARCEKKCTKKRLCGKHRCNQRCCIELDHICPLPCNRQLSCGQHRCPLTCHSGHCPNCLETSFDELYCECGATVTYPPIPCGTKPPICNRPCSKIRPCGHDANHLCHTGNCTPCTVLCKRWCFGRHAQRSAIPCYQQDFSCGLPCGKPMPCGRHQCVKPCHSGECPVPCKQPCTVPRQLCGHPCGKPCHTGACQESICKAIVEVTCLCGLQKNKRPCIEVLEEYRNFEMAQIKDKINSGDQSVDITDLVSKIKRPVTLKILECTEECKVLERNRKLAIGLQIRNPDLSQKLTPRYTDFMRSWAKKDPHFCQRIHEKLSELVQLAKQSKQKSRSYSFDSMNRDKRHFVHEYCEHFGVESAAYDLEPNRNIVATATKDKSWLPSMSLLEVIQRENGHRKVPGPVMNKSTGTGGRFEGVSIKLPGRIFDPAL